MPEVQTPFYDELAKKYGFTEKLTDSQIEGRDVVSPEGSIDIYEDSTVNPELFGVEKDHQALQPPTYEAPSHIELLRDSIDASPELVLVKDITNVGETLVGKVRRQHIAA